MLQRGQQRMNGISNSSKNSPASLKQQQPSIHHQEEEVVRRKSRPRERPQGDSIQPPPHPRRLAKLFRDSRTNLILKRVFCELCMKDTRQVERELMRLSDSNPDDGKLVKRASTLIVDFIKETEQISNNMDVFTGQEEWNLNAGNVYMEFSKVATETFKSTVNWGRIVMFLGFAVSFSLYLEQDIMVGSPDSVLQWTGQVLEEDVGEFITSHGGWVSPGSL